MDREQTWQHVEHARSSLADLLESLTDEEWEHPSLCAGWRVRDVAAHVVLGAQPPSPWSLVTAAVRAKGNFHRLNRDITVHYARSSGVDLVAELRAHAGSRKLPPVTNLHNVLFDVLVHSQDIAIPLGREHPMPLAAACAGAGRVWAMGWPFWARRRFAEFRLDATDVDWAVGAGPREVRGPVGALLLLLTGRTAAAVPRLTGDGVAALVHADAE
jgi:uncharacterized protein (TIGR03083 family)